MKKIILTQNKVALIDDDMFDRVNYFKWCVDKTRNTFYAKSSLPGYVSLRMHQLVMGMPSSDVDIDHADGNGLNNQKFNLRQTTRQQNQRNQNKAKGCSSQYKGVCWHKPNQLWVAHININYKSKHLGCFALEEEAALAYNEAALKLFGEHAKLNTLININ